MQEVFEFDNDEDFEIYPFGKGQHDTCSACPAACHTPIGHHRKPIRSSGEGLNVTPLQKICQP